MTRSAPASLALQQEGQQARPAGRLRPLSNLVRSLVAAAARAAGDPRLGDAEGVMARTHPTDTHSLAVLRAASSPGSLSASGWAAVQQSAVDLVANLGPSSASSALFKAALGVDLAGKSLLIPSIAPAASAVSFVEELAPIPVASFDTSTSATLVPFKLAALVAVTRELVKSGNAESVIRALMTESTALGLDAALFSTAAASASRPAGILLNATDVSSGGSMIDDLGALAGAVAPVAGTAVIFVATPAVYAKIRMALPQFPWPVYPSAALAVGQVVAVAANALVVAVGAPTIDVTGEALIHMSTTPAAIVASGATADPTRSLFQSDAIAIRLILGVTWGLRTSAASAVATATGSGW